jgi:hypothetical protein
MALPRTPVPPVTSTTRGFIGYRRSLSRTGTGARRDYTAFLQKPGNPLN